MALSGQNPWPATILYGICPHSIVQHLHRPTAHYNVRSHPSIERIAQLHRQLHRQMHRQMRWISRDRTHCVPLFCAINTAFQLPHAFYTYLFNDVQCNWQLSDAFN